MSEHPSSFKAEQQVSPQTAQNLVAGDHNTEITAKPKQSLKDRLRRALLATAAVAVLSGASWYGYDYVTVGRFLVSTDDAYVKADNTTIAPKVSGYLTASHGRRQRARRRGRSAGPHRRPRFPRRARPSQGRRRCHACGDRRASRRSSTPSRRSSTPPRRRSMSTRRSSPSPSRRTSVTPTSPPQATAACRTRSRRSRAFRPRRRPCSATPQTLHPR